MWHDFTPIVLRTSDLVEFSARMNLVERERVIDIVAASGTVRVTINPRRTWMSVLLEAAGIVAFGVITVRDWAPMALWLRVLLEA